MTALVADCEYIYVLNILSFVCPITPEFISHISRLYFYEVSNMLINIFACEFVYLTQSN